MGIDWYLCVGKNKFLGYDFDKNKDCAMIDDKIFYFDTYEDAVAAVH